MQEIMQFVGNHPMLSLAWLVLLSTVIFVSFQSWCSKIGEITSGEAISLINKEDAVIIDLRSRDDYCQGHITNSINLADTGIQNGNLGSLEKAKNRPVVVIGNSGMTSRHSANNLYKAGFERVYVLKEGITGWRADHLPLIRGK
ncbi:rhodanese-like domain-containing protein [Candidatus Palibaumannia cicadellinicola]|uniref:Rhodanese-like domain-containing protein n=1 Tax=Candidatus Palibaumannia cicadellinicola TaxID=186490 RepID=A0A2N4XWR6_9GAMM|nr:rhodanese-like domain-containing protein [Candidatus Baumannia cicadellinicola]PLK58542.1 rhodanese-like domain-containing protein [Candidatus Baumannia cicadellinicola]